MRTTFKITDKELFDKYVDDIDTCRLTCTENFGRRREFMAHGDLFILFNTHENWVTHSGEFFSDDYLEYGFELTPLKDGY